MSGPDSLADFNVKRAHWPRALMALPKSQVTDVINSVSAPLKVRLTQLPAAGLGLLKFNESALNQAFYLGEFPLATASVELSLEDGKTATGAAQVMNDDADFATRLAIADAILANHFPGSAEIAKLVNEGEAVFANEQGVRQEMLSRTKVDFSLLSMADEVDDE